MRLFFGQILLCVSLVVGVALPETLTQAQTVSSVIGFLALLVLPMDG